MTSRRSTALILLGVLAVLVLGVFAYRLTARRSVDTTSLTVAVGLVAALAGLLAAVATAYAAVAALRAARESSVAATRSTEALGLALEPTLKVGIEGPDPSGLAITGPGTTVVRLRNISRWPASNVVMHVEAADGRSATLSLAYLSPEPAEHTFSFEDRQPVPSDDPAWRGTVDLTDRIVTEYSDERGLLRWRMTSTSTLTRDYGPRFLTSSSSSTTDTKRLS